VTTLTRGQIQAAETALDEGKKEVRFADRLLEGWAYDSRHTGLPATVTHCTLAAYRPPAETDSVVAARAMSLELTDDQFLAIDRSVGKLPPSLKRIVFIEYWRHGPQRQKARAMNLKYGEYRERLVAARWGVYLLLQPAVERWRSEFGGE
jgi:DNA-directed RNA polymerase specialized sigma24 family protein